MLVSNFNLSQSFNYTSYLFYKKTVQIRDQYFMYVNPEKSVFCRLWLCNHKGPLHPTSDSQIIALFYSKSARIRASPASVAKIETYFWTLCSRPTPGHRPSQFWTMVRTTATFTTWWTGRGLFWTLPTPRRQTTASARSTQQLTATSTNESNFSPARPNHNNICSWSNIRTCCGNYAYVNIFRWKFNMDKRLILGILYTGFGKK